MRLFIAEKPSLGAEIAKWLTGPQVRKDGYIETGEGIVTWVFGHILQQAEPEDYDEKYKKWRIDDLPIIPDPWKLLVSEGSKKQFNIIKTLLKNADEIVHAGDPDREGQLLVDELLEYLNNRKPVKRILLNALDEKSIKKALQNLRNNSDFVSLKKSALARSRADWLVGMNLSRAYTIAAQHAGHKVTFPIGRVKTPTLALTVRRQQEISQFVPVDYFVIKADFSYLDQVFTTTLKPSDLQKGLDSEGRLVDEEQAKLLIAKLNAANHIGEITKYDIVEKKESQRLGYSLSTLQIDCGKKFGYDPQTVLNTCQSLYEKKFTTYPRSDCNFLPENQFADHTAILQNIGQLPDFTEAVKKANGSIKSRIWNDKKISAHHAIIPTTVPVKTDTLTVVEKNVYLLIAKSYLAQFYPVHVYNQTNLTVFYADENFTASGKTIITMGWKELYSKEKDDEEAPLPVMNIGTKTPFVKAVSEKKATKPPENFTQSSLLEAMKNIYKYVKDEVLKKQLKDISGIGTEATRATIIKELVEKGFLTETKKKLFPTEKAYLLMSLLPDELTYPDTTALWENVLHDITEKKAEMENFMTEQTNLVNKLCEETKNLNITPHEEDGIACPTCKQGVLRQINGAKGKFWGCSRYPDCKATFPDNKNKPMLATFTCPKCGSELKQRKGSKGAFWGCSHYPDCKATFPDLKGKPDFTEKAADSGYTCPKCGSALRQLKGSKGTFWGCTNYPNCKATYPDNKNKPMLETFTCPKCGSELTQRKGSKGAFWGCRNYPDCKATYPDLKGKPDFTEKADSEYKCPNCGGALRQRKGSKGAFWGCSHYPDCKTTFPDKNGKPEM